MVPVGGNCQNHYLYCRAECPDWQLDNKGKYSSSSLYHVINFRGVQPVFILAVWKLRVPPKIHVFLWLLSKNKLMTRDNLRKRHIIKPLDCVYCLEQESCSHLFFECIVAKHIWAHIEEYFSSQIGSSFESVPDSGLLPKSAQF